MRECRQAVFVAQWYLVVIESALFEKDHKKKNNKNRKDEPTDANLTQRIRATKADSSGDAFPSGEVSPSSCTAP